MASAGMTRMAPSASVATTIVPPDEVESAASRRVMLVLRALQLATSAVALALFAGGFKGTTVTVPDGDGSQVDITIYYGGPSVSFALLVTFSASLFCAAWVALVFVLRWADLPSKWALGVDAGFTVFQLSAGCALAGSDYVRYCDLLGSHVDCALLKCGAGLCLAAFVVFLASVGWTAWRISAWRTHRPGRKNTRSAHKTDVRRMRGASATTPVVVKMPDEYGDMDLDAMDQAAGHAVTPDAAYHRQLPAQTSP